MLTVNTFIAPSPISGLGCFLEEPVLRGQVLWVFDPRFDLLFSTEELPRMQSAYRNLIEHYGYFDSCQFKGWWVLPCGDDRFCNHSKTPTLITRRHADCIYTMVASEDMGKGTELTVDYRDYEPIERVPS